MRRRTQSTWRVTSKRTARSKAHSKTFFTFPSAQKYASSLLVAYTERDTSYNRMRHRVGIEVEPCVSVRMEQGVTEWQESVEIDVTTGLVAPPKRRKSLRSQVAAASRPIDRAKLFASHALGERWHAAIGSSAEKVAERQAMLDEFVGLPVEVRRHAVMLASDEDNRGEFPAMDAVVDAWLAG